MNVSAAIADSEVRIQCGILSSRHDHAKGARPRKRGGDAPGHGRTGVQAGGLATQSVNILFKDASLPRGLGSESCLAHSYKGASPLVESPRRGHTPFGTPRRSVTPPRGSARLSRLATARFRDEPS